MGQPLAEPGRKRDLFLGAARVADAREKNGENAGGLMVPRIS
jgi:hypothetical protein